MYWLKFLLVLIFYTHSVSALWGVRGVCEKVFQKHTVFFSSHDFKNPLSKTLVESYWLAYHLEFFTNQNKKQLKQWERGLREMVEILEHSISRPASAQVLQLKQGNVSLEEVIYKIPQLIDFARKSPSESALSHRQTVEAVMAVFAKILPTAVKESDHRQVHWNRIHFILKEIANFEGKDEQNYQFAFYKINRAIEKWYSIKEFIRCKV